MSKRDETKKLTLKRETLRVLTPDELRLVAGGRPIRNNCTDEALGLHLLILGRRAGRRVGSSPGG